MYAQPMLRLTDSRASRATRATRGDAHPARQSAHWQYCTSQHGVEQCTEGHCVGRQPACLSTEQERMLRTLAQHQLASKHSGALTTAQHTTSTQLHCSTLKLRSLPLLSQLCAVRLRVLVDGCAVVSRSCVFLYFKEGIA